LFDDISLLFFAEKAFYFFDKLLLTLLKSELCPTSLEETKHLVFGNIYNGGGGFV